jgi:DNA-binding transcriptional MerR regulator
MTPILHAQGNLVVDEVAGTNGSSRGEQDVEEIAKKDLLRETGISYGQFYRWKRMGLIPEAWFRRRSTFTGQESFLPRRKVLERIERIQGLKDRLSLDEITDMLSPSSTRCVYSLSEAREIRAFDPRAFALLPTASDNLHYLDLLGLMLIETLLAKGLSEHQVRIACRTLLETFGEIDEAAADRSLSVCMNGEAAICALHTGACLFDSDTTVLATVNLSKLIEDLNLALRDAEPT